MCLTVLPGCKPQIAKRGITCWKVIKPFDNYKWEAPYRGTVHKYNEVLTASDKLLVEHRCECDNFMVVFNYIGEGFHAYTNEDGALYQTRNLVCMNSSYTLTKCTIPKGAEYCMGMYNEIVANKMIVHKPKTES